MMEEKSSMTMRIAQIGFAASTVCVLGLIVFVPLLLLRTATTKADIEEMSFQFKESSDEVWAKMMTLGQEASPVEAKLPKVQFFSLRKRQAWAGSVCQGCFALSCPPGMPGPGGDPGIDGIPGESGRPGQAGDDGYDVQLDVSEELACVICPGGPPGQRGAQGERGITGFPGAPGPRGPPGGIGPDGPQGDPGKAGTEGEKGPEGPYGPPGDTIIAGIGIKGPKGPSGPRGPKGPPGPRGKRSADSGMPGQPGPAGPVGPVGRSGTVGEEGPYGPPGEPGQPAQYCPSDCGVSHILAPTQVNVAAKNYDADAPTNAVTEPEDEQSEVQPASVSQEYRRRLAITKL
uniref:Col_cuticle_N domain-containing protein n=1 Tax=Panagrellus redivivus TaxID=6233 RepID=A0A7E4UVA2_PANRE